MNKVAFIFRTPPHGSASGREGLDAALATSALSENIGLFFVDDGVYQLLTGQAPNAILGRDYAPTFGLLELYDVEHVYVCEQSLAERGLTSAQIGIAAHMVCASQWQQCLSDYQVRLSF
ncbi:MAG: sulfurtransferase complex subunit TusC [Oceanisphaera sp.]|uniref:sulfurtransferase complex subunit TusC n=1 Tax=Oceanisphaera sp. TaxID=1929979 RepID=UPI003F993136